MEFAIWGKKKGREEDIIKIKIMKMKWMLIELFIF
jgi:hypothetical protein